MVVGSDSDKFYYKDIAIYRSVFCKHFCMTYVFPHFSSETSKAQSSFVVKCIFFAKISVVRKKLS